MNIALDAREAYAAQKAGKGQWTKGFLEELQTRNLSIKPLTQDQFSSGWRWHKQAASFVEKEKFDLYVSPTSMITPMLLKCVPFVPVIHDLIAFRSEPHSIKAKVIEQLLLPKVVKRAAHICTVSDTTKTDLLERYPHLDAENVTPIFAGPMKSSVPSNASDGKTILCAGTLCPRKNQLRLIRAYAALPEHLRKEYRLLLVGGRGWNDQEIVDMSSKVKGVEWRDYVSDDEYQELLSSAAIFAYPSLYEGFGLQVLDALQRGIPILTSNRGSLSEVVGDSAFVVDPESDTSIMMGLKELLEQKELQETLRSSGPIQAEQFSWKRTVDLFLEAAQKAL